MDRTILTNALCSMLSIAPTFVVNTQAITLLNIYLGEDKNLFAHGSTIELTYAEDDMYCMSNGVAAIHIHRYDDPMLNKFFEEGITWNMRISPEDFETMHTVYEGDMEDRLRS